MTDHPEGDDAAFDLAVLILVAIGIILALGMRFNG